MLPQAVGYVGLVAFALAWLPQSWETVRAGQCGLNPAFLVLSAVGSVALTAYAFLRGDPVFGALNVMTSLGALVNIWYRVRPRRAESMKRCTASSRARASRTSWSRSSTPSSASRSARRACWTPEIFVSTRATAPFVREDARPSS